MVSTREREQGFEDGGVEGKKALGNAKKTVLDLHTKKDTRGRSITMSNRLTGKACGGHKPGRPPFRLSSKIGHVFQ